MKTILLILLAIIILNILWDIISISFLLRKTDILIKKTRAYERRISNAKMRILVAGDSTAVGTGSEKPEESTAGRLGALYSDAEIINISENGLRIAGLQKYFDTMNHTEHFDIALIQIGANDIMKLTKMADIEKGIIKILDRTKLFGGKVIILHSGNIGESTFFPWYVRPILSKRSLAVREIYKREAAEHGANYIDLISTMPAKMLEKHPNYYYGEDDLHLNGEGYGLWFGEISRYL